MKKISVTILVIIILITVMLIVVQPLFAKPFIIPVPEQAMIHSPVISELDSTEATYRTVGKNNPHWLDTNNPSVVYEDNFSINWEVAKWKHHD